MYRRTHSGGYVLIWLAITMTAMIAFVSFAVDLGRVEVAKTELRRAADAAARYATVGLSNGSAAAYAIAAANDNLVDGTPMVLLNSDVTSGNWTAGTFTAAGTPANAVQITAVRSAARSTGVPLLFAQIFGQRTCDMHVTVIASSTSKLPTGMIGLNTIQLSGSASTSYNSANGATSWQTAPTNNILMESNGQIKLSGSSVIQGSARPGIGQTVNLSGSAAVTGSTAPLTTTLSYPAATAGAAATTNNNAVIPNTILQGNGSFNANNNYTMPAGTYYFNDFQTSGSAVLSFSGPVVIYVTGQVNLSGGSVATASSIPANLQIIVCSTHDVQVSGSSALYAEIYCPTSKFAVSGSGVFCGSVVAVEIDSSGSASLSADNSLINSSGGITLVQ